MFSINFIYNFVRMSKDNISIQSPITESKTIQSGITTNLIIQSPIGVEGGDTAYIFTIDTSLGTGDSFQLPTVIANTYNCVVNWGDGNEDTITAYDQAETLHTYSSPFNGQISISGKFGGWSFNDSGDKLKITSVDAWGDVGFVYLSGAFFGCTNLTNIDAGILDLSLVVNIFRFVGSCTNLVTFNTSGWDTSTITNMGSFAQDCINLEVLDVSSFDVSNVTLLSLFIRNCVKLTTIDVSRWNTQNVEIFYFFAQGCTLLNTLDVSGFDMSSATNVERMAQACPNLIIFNTDSWDTSTITNCVNMLAGGTSLTSNFTAALWWDRAVPFTTFAGCFTNCTNISNYASIPNNWKGL